MKYEKPILDEKKDDVILTEEEMMLPSEFRAKLRRENGFGLKTTTTNTHGIECRSSILGTMGRIVRCSDLDERYKEIIERD